MLLYCAVSSKQQVSGVPLRLLGSRDIFSLTSSRLQFIYVRCLLLTPFPALLLYSVWELVYGGEKREKKKGHKSKVALVL